MPSGACDPDAYPPERHGFLLELMRKFELCFTFPDDQGRYLNSQLSTKTAAGGGRAVPAGRVPELPVSLSLCCRKASCPGSSCARTFSVQGSQNGAQA